MENLRTACYLLFSTLLTLIALVLLYTGGLRAIGLLASLFNRRPKQAQAIVSEPVGESWVPAGVRSTL